MEVTSAVEIDRPAAEVFDYLANMENNPAWQNGQVSCTWTSEPPVRLGSTYDQEAKFLGKSIVSSFSVTEFEPGHLIRIVSTGGTMDIDVTRTVTELAATRCRADAIVRGDAPGPMKLLGPLLPTLVRSSVNKDYQRLKALLGSR